MVNQWFNGVENRTFYLLLLPLSYIQRQDIGGMFSFFYAVNISPLQILFVLTQKVTIVTTLFGKH
jgi:hypothetical protein